MIFFMSAFAKGYDWQAAKVEDGLIFYGNDINYLFLLKISNTLAIDKEPSNVSINIPFLS